MAKVKHLIELPRRDIMFGALFTALTAGCIFLRPRRIYPRLSETELSRAFPDRVGAYRPDALGDFILPPTDALSSKLYDKVVTRLYVAPGQPPIMALFAYGSAQNLTLQLHRPDECYPMLGFDTSPVQPVPLAMAGHAIPASFLTARRPDRVEQVLYWSRIGPDFPRDSRAETLLVAEQNLRGSMPDGLLLRLSIIDERRDDALAQMHDFMTMLGAALPPLGRRILMGEGAVRRT